MKKKEKEIIGPIFVLNVFLESFLKTILIFSLVW